MGAQRDANGFATAYPNGDPEVIDIGRHPVGFRGERDGRSSQMDKISVPQGKVAVLLALAVSVRQSRKSKRLVGGKGSSGM
jgi:hypothetical protein